MSELVPTKIKVRQPPTVVQALMLPFYDIPKPEGYVGELHNDPKLNQIKSEVKVCTVIMVVVPAFVYYYSLSYFDINDPNRTLWPPVLAVVSIQVVIVVIAIWKYFEDFKSVFWDGTGDIPYDAT